VNKQTNKTNKETNKQNVRGIMAPWHVELHSEGIDVPTGLIMATLPVAFVIRTTAGGRVLRSPKCLGAGPQHGPPLSHHHHPTCQSRNIIAIKSINKQVINKQMTNKQANNQHNAKKT